MDRDMITIDPTTTRLRRVGRLARRRMRILGDELRNGTHTDGTLSVTISGLASPVAGVPDLFEWEADRPVALVIVRAGIDGEDVTFDVGPSRHGIGRATAVGDGSGIRYVAFCYDAPIAPPVTTPGLAPAGAAVVATSAPVAGGAVAIAPAADTGPVAGPAGLPATRPFAPTHRDRRSILSFLFQGARRATGGALA